MTRTPAVSEEKNISFKIDHELHKEFRMLCFKRNTNIKQALLEYIERQVSSRSGE